MRSLLLALVLIGSLPWILKRTHIGVLVWSWLSYMNPHRIVWGFATSVHWSLVVGLCTLVSLVISREPKRFPMTPVTAVYILWVLWMCFTTLFALGPQNEVWEEWERTMKIQLMSFVTLMVMGHRDRLNALVWVIVISLGFWGVKGGFWVLLTGGEWLTHPHTAIVQQFHRPGGFRTADWPPSRFHPIAANNTVRSW